MQHLSVSYLLLNVDVDDTALNLFASAALKVSSAINRLLQSEGAGLQRESGIPLSVHIVDAFCFMCIMWARFKHTFLNICLFFLNYIFAYTTVCFRW